MAALPNHGNVGLHDDLRLFKSDGDKHFLIIKYVRLIFEERVQSCHSKDNYSSEIYGFVYTFGAAEGSRA